MAKDCARMAALATRMSRCRSTRRPPLVGEGGGRAQRRRSTLSPRLCKAACAQGWQADRATLGAAIAAASEAWLRSLGALSSITASIRASEIGEG
jgi:hypothetical protein